MCIRDRFIYLLLDNETAADVLIEMDEDARKEFLEILPSEVYKPCGQYACVQDRKSLNKSEDKYLFCC